nr:hypothetical protein [Tanacetum cinerariifolium]
AFQLTAPTNNNQRTSSNPRNRQIAQPVMNLGQDRQTQDVGGNGGNQFAQYDGQNGLVVVPGIANQGGTGNVIAARAEGTGNGNQSSIHPYLVLSMTIYYTDSSAEVQLNDNCYDNEIFNMFTQEEQYMDLLKPIPEQQLVPQNDNHVTSIAPSMV